METEGQPTNAMPVMAPSPAPVPQEPEQQTSTPFGPTTGIAHPIPIPTRQADWETGFQNEHGPRPSRWEAWGSIPFQEGAHQTIASPWGGALLRMFQEDHSKTGQSLPADEANKLYPGRPIPYTTPVDQGVALMEYNDRQKQQAMADWSAQRPMTFMGKVVSKSFGMIGGLTDPINLSIGVMTGGISELLAPEAAGIAGKVATHYLGNLGGFSGTEALQNLIEHQMGAKQKQMSEIVKDNVVPAAGMTAIGVGLGALARKWANRAGGTSEADLSAVKKTVAALEQDQKVPQLEEQRAVLAERKAGVNRPQGPNGEKVIPTLLTSPIQETPLYAAAHSDGTPLTHEHGLGPGHQFTDAYDVANNGVSRSTETPGQIGETRLPEGTKLLNIDQAGSDQAEFVRAIEEKTGIPLESALKNGESLKDIITNLGDWSGAEIGDGRVVPENILKQIQDIAKEQGYHGYQFAGGMEDGRITNRQVHMFDTDGMQVSKSYTSDPNTTSELPESQRAKPEVDGTQSKQIENPAMDKTQSKFYSPEIEKLAHEFRKGKTFDPYSPEQLADTQAQIEQYKQQLADLSKTSETAAEALEELRSQEAQDSRLRDIARRIAECGQGGGV